MKTPKINRSLLAIRDARTSDIYFPLSSLYLNKETSRAYKLKAMEIVGLDLRCCTALRISKYNIKLPLSNSTLSVIVLYLVMLERLLRFCENFYLSKNSNSLMSRTKTIYHKFQDFESTWDLSTITTIRSMKTYVDLIYLKVSKNV